MPYTSVGKYNDLIGMQKWVQGDDLGQDPPVYTVSHGGIFDWGKTWFRTPSFRSFGTGKKSKFKMPWNSFQHRKAEQSLLTGSLTMKSKSAYGGRPHYYQTLSGEVDSGNSAWQPYFFSAHSLIPSQLQAEMDAILFQKLRAKVKGQSVNLAQAFAERIQTANLVATTCKRLAQSYLYLKKGNLKDAAGVLGLSVDTQAIRGYNTRYARNRKQAAASLWLEMQYGWKPLLADVYGSIEAMNKAADYREPRQAVRVTHYMSGKFNRKDACGPGQLFMSREWGTWTFRGSATAVFELDSIALKTASEVGISNPVNLAWELLPYSFVADWFIPIGNYLNNLDATSGVSFLRGTYNHAYDAYCDQWMYSPGDTADWTLTGSMQRFMSVKDYSRNVLTGWPDNILPPLKNPFSFDHVANAIALLTLAFKR